ncbi:MAG: hypothetical protein QOI42_1284, partial [Frankiaceae bacterium]|nr:hypothetical protein [Frankiaceae bacterium]
MTATELLPRAGGAAAGAATLTADDVSAWFGTHQVLHRVSLTAAPG